MKVLFVGGLKDGKREIWPPHVGYRCAISEFSNKPFYDSPIDSFISHIKVHYYNLKRFKDDDGSIYKVAFHEDIKNPMAALIKGYHYHRKPKYGRSRRVPKIP